MLTIRGVGTVDVGMLSGCFMMMKLTQLSQMKYTSSLFTITRVIIDLQKGNSTRSNFIVVNSERPSLSENGEDNLDLN